jgi:hypothetical protein
MLQYGPPSDPRCPSQHEYSPRVSKRRASNAHNARHSANQARPSDSTPSPTLSLSTRQSHEATRSEPHCSSCSRSHSPQTSITRQQQWILSITPASTAASRCSPATSSRAAPHPTRKYRFTAPRRRRPSRASRLLCWAPRVVGQQVQAHILILEDLGVPSCLSCPAAPLAAAAAAAVFSSPSPSSESSLSSFWSRLA